MATFDAARLDPAQYTLETPSDALRLQATAEAFMNLIRTNPASFEENKNLIVDFCTLIDHDKRFPLAAMVVPELRRPQSYDTSAKTLINTILRKPEIERRRPAAPPNDADDSEWKRLEFQQIRSMMEYLAYGPGGDEEAGQEEREQVERDIERARDIIMRR